MFEQFRENIRLTGETYIAAKQGSKSVLEGFKNASRPRKALWISILVAITLPSILSKYSVPWYYQALLVFALVILQLWLWIGKTSDNTQR